MRTSRPRKAAILVRGLSLTLAAAMVLAQAPAHAEVIGYSGTTSAQIPAVPANVDLFLEINGQPHESKSVDDSLSGTLTLTYAASQEEPGISVQGCAGGARGGGILLEGATPSTKLTARWVPLTGQARTIGPVDVPSDGGYVVASVCSSNGGGRGGGGGQTGGGGSAHGETLPCAGSRGNGSGDGKGSGRGNAGSGQGNAYGHQCH